MNSTEIIQGIVKEVYEKHKEGKTTNRAVKRRAYRAWLKFHKRMFGVAVKQPGFNVVEFEKRFLSKYPNPMYLNFEFQSEIQK